MSVNTTEVSLKNFFIFHAKYGEKEGEEEEKIIYFYPKRTPLDMQMKEVGLCEAIIKFIQNFSTSPCEALKTEKTQKLFYQPEENFWMVMTINIPFGPRSKDVLEGSEHLDHEVKMPVFKAVLKQAYQTSRLILGPFQNILDSGNGVLSELKSKCDNFFSKYLANLKLKQCDIIDVFQGVEYLGLEKPLFLLSQSLANQVEGKFPIFDYSLLLYEEKIVWSGLELEDAQLLYKYLVSCLIPSFLFKTNKTTSSNLTLPPSMRFIFGSQGKERKVYLSKVANPGFYNLIVYRVNLATLCLLSNCSSVIKDELFGKLDDFLRDKMNNICAEIVMSKKPKPQITELQDSSSLRFAYFNSTNLATKSTLHDLRIGQPPAQKESLRLLVDICQQLSDLREQGCKSSEFLYKCLSDQWVIGMMSNGRQFYVTIDRKKANLLDISNFFNIFPGEVNYICDKQLKGIFFHV
ncbi:vacuolar fusion protein CCZ1 homolog isoform X1 [Cimex lectularius]|uniref:Vacuolar fusion protein CCZ1 homolog n=1 Tax=Cimex lectularius TaxID=79782 RepID=A0A8I6TF50_CIMLE|nr:vacuolar fusion protein CCZ1 homolog isoform X1 [Cimex lectularius]